LPAAILAALLCVSAAQPASASADLVVSDATFAPSRPLAGSTVVLEITVGNAGDGDASSQFFVRIRIDGGYHGSLAINGGLPSGDEKTVSTAWTAEEGTHWVEISVDEPLDRIPEKDEANNVVGFEIDVPKMDEIAQRVGGVRVAVGPFEDRSGSGWNNVAGGVADKVGQQLEAAGVRTVQRSEFTEAMQREGLNPFSLFDASAGAQLLGADILLTGAVVDLATEEVSLSLGPLHLGYATANASLFADLFDVVELSPIASLSEEGHEEGSTAFSVDLESLFAVPGTTGVCAGGLSADREIYHVGEAVSIGYFTSATSAWYGVEIHTTMGGFVRWLGWQYVEIGTCGRWFWDQRDSFGSQVSAGVYIAKLWDGVNHILTANLQIQPGWSLFPLFDEITVGSAAFEESVVGGAIDQAVDRLVSRVVETLEGHASSAPKASASLALGESAGPAPLEGRVAAILPDGRIALNIGELADVSRGDFFDVIDAEALSVRGEVVIVEVRDTVSYAVPTVPFTVEIGDLVRRVEL